MGKVNRAKVIATAHKYLAKGNLKRAVKEYEKVLKDDPSDIRTKLKVADLLFRLGERTRATDTFEEVARFYSGQGFLLKAVAVYKQVQKLKPDDIEIHMALAELYQQIGLVSDAINQYRESISLQEKAGLTMDRLKTAQRMLELDPDNARLRIKLAEDFSREGMIEEAVHEFRSAYDALRRSGLDEEALQVGERLLYHQPDDWETAKALASHYIEQKDNLRALTRLQVCFRSRPNDPEVLDLLGRVFESLGQPQKAATVLKALARQYDRTGLIRDRDEVYARVLKLNPGDRSAAEALRYAPPAEVPAGDEIEFDATSKSDIDEVLVSDYDDEIPIDEVDDVTDPDIKAAQPLESDDFPEGVVDDDRAGLPPSYTGDTEPTIIQAMDARFFAGATGQSDNADLDLRDVPADLRDDVQNLDFLIDAGLLDEAEDLLGDIRARTINIPLFDQLEEIIKAKKTAEDTI